MRFDELGPGTLVRLRGREWIVLNRDEGGPLTVRPLGASDAEAQIVLPEIEGAIEPAHFEKPDGSNPGPSAEARLLRESLILTLRRGAGPFRSFGRLSFDPRAYQLVPLLMALKLDPVRLLIADDVGVGKTIEAGLIAREMIDRGEVRGLSVVCPPHLVEQWIDELRAKFSIDAVPVTAATASRLERGLRVGASLFEEHPFTVVSLDYIKKAERASEFSRSCPKLVIVDEAHACVGGGAGRRHQRYSLLQKLSEDRARHVILLTATPHSGDANAFARLAGLLDSDFATLGDSEALHQQELRERFGSHYVQRRRIDIDAWKEPGLFPVPETKEETYRLHPDAAAFYEDVLDYCATVTERAGGMRERRLAFWGTLALMRCVASSPIAAFNALKTRAKAAEPSEEEERLLASHAFDGDDDDWSLDDSDPVAPDDPALQRLLTRAAELAQNPSKDEKLKKLLRELKALIQDGFRPVIFCRFIGTAQNVAAAVEAAFPAHTIGLITGMLPPEERKAQVELIGQADERILIATDCLSEGINLQSYFDAVIHYDLSWNPTRHQQREGRVNRFGQKSKIVRSLLLYGENNPVDGAVLEVILRKAAQIQKATGVPVPLPDDERAMTEALMQAVMLRRKTIDANQPSLFASLPEARKIEKVWQDAADRERRSQTIYAQRALKPEAVIPEWTKARAALGGGEVTRHFLEASFARFGAPLNRSGNHYTLRVPTDPAFQSLSEQLVAAGVKDGARLTFDPSPDHEFVHRAHPLVTIVAEALFERALDPGAAPSGDIATLSRCGAWLSNAVPATTTIAFLRLRHRLEQKDGTTLLAEEAAALAWAGNDGAGATVFGEAAFALLDAPAEGELAASARSRLLETARTRVENARADLDRYAKERAEALGEDHDRVRAATMRDRRTSVERISVTPVLPVDVIGLYVLVPVAH